MDNNNFLLAWATLIETLIMTSAGCLTLYLSANTVSKKSVYTNTNPTIIIYVWYQFLWSFTTIIYCLYVLILWRPNIILYENKTFYSIGLPSYFLLFLNTIIEGFLGIDRIFTILYPWKYRDRKKKIFEHVGSRKQDMNATYCNVVKDNNDNKRKKKNKDNRKQDQKNESSSSANDKKKAPVCKFDGNQHFTSDCSKYSTAEERIKVCDDKKLCKKCLNVNHTVKECKSRYSCYYCKGRNHNSALCFKKFGTPKAKNTKTNMVVNCNADSDSDTVASDQIKNKPINVTTAMAAKATDDTVLPIIEIPVAHPKSYQLRRAPVLMDCGSMASYITFHLAEQLQLPVVRYETLHIETFNCPEPLTKDTKLYLLKVQRKNGDFDNIYVFGVGSITKKMTMALLDKCKDITFKYTVPDILIGSNYFWKFFNSKRLPSGFYQADTVFGPIICGAGPTVVSTNVTTLTVYSDAMSSLEELDVKISQQWKLENIGIADDPEKTDREIVDEFFKKTAYRNPEGRYVVRLPWKTDNPILPEHNDMCFYRLQSLVKQLVKDGKLNAMMDVLKDHLQRGFFEFVTPEMDEKCIMKHYIPYHCVYKDSLTTPVRVVFDCSAKYGKTGVSLNSLLYNGPPQMPNPVGLMLRFRSQPIVVTADIAKAFMQIMLNELDRDVFRFYVIIDPEKPVTRENVREARYTRPIFGSGPSPLFLEQVIYDKFSKLPDATAVEILENNWVDNIEIGGPDASTVIQKCQFAKKNFDEIGMDLRDFVSNNDEVNTVMNSPDPDATKFLGVPCKPKADLFILRIPVFIKANKNDLPTKRSILSAVASIYDPCGLLSPVVLKGKSYIQQLWKRKVTWDEPLEGYDNDWWNSFKDSNENKEFPLQRCIIFPEAVENELHVFCDASNDGFSAAAYIRQRMPNGSYITNILVAKSRVTDVQKTTIPKLELIAATIGSSLLVFVQKEMHIKFAKAILWTDSSCVMGWLASNEVKHGRFIDNRLKHIKERVQMIKHVRTDQNPADIGSRGCDFDELARRKIWWHGPEFFLLNEEDWPIDAVKAVEFDKAAMDRDKVFDLSSENENKRKADTTTLNVATKKAKRESTPIKNFLPVNVERFSKWKRFVGTTAAVLYFTKRYWNFAETYVIEKLISTNLTSYNDPKMLELAELAIILNIQRKYPPTDKIIRDLKLRQNFYGMYWEVSNRIPTPELIWLPKCRETELLILDIHSKLLHAGPRHTLNTLREKYWLCRGKAVVNKVLHHDCLHCKMLKLKPYLLPPMPELPHQRTTVANPFKFTGVDYAGPFYHNVNGISTKIYIILFTCMITRNIHLEVSLSANGDHFIMAFRRFIARRAKPAEIYSDNATNLVLAKKVIEPFWDTENDPVLKEFLKAQKIEWNLIKEKSPWKGGFYERLIGITKNALKHAVGRNILKYEPFCTLVIEIESIVNSRPITQVDSEYDHDGKNMALRPIDFLLQDYHGYFPTVADDTDPTFVMKESNEENLKKLYNQTAACRQRFWKIWQTDYINCLRERTTYYHRQEKFSDAAPKVGSVVHVCDNDQLVPENQYRVGLIMELNESSDKEIRTAKVKMGNGRILNRPINFLYPLELQINDPKSITNEKQATNPQTPKEKENSAQQGHGYNLRPRGKTTTLLALALCTLAPTTEIQTTNLVIEQVESQCLVEIGPTTKKECDDRKKKVVYPGRQPPKSAFFLTVLSCLILQTFGNPCVNLTTSANLVAAEYCRNSGLLVFKQNNEYCHTKVDCKELFIRGKTSSNGRYCGERCYCPTWSSECSFYKGPAHDNSTINDPKVKQLIEAAKPETKTTYMFQIQLADKTKHFVNKLDILHQQLDPNIFECVGRGNKTSGTPYYCAHHHCDAHANRFCYYQTHETVYWITGKSRVPIVAWGLIEVDIEEEKPKSYPPATVSCIEGILYGNASRTVTLVEISTKTHYYAEYIKNVQFKVPLPTTFATSTRTYDLKIVYFDEQQEMQNVHCEEIDYCSHIACYFCIDQFINPDCAPFKVLLVVLMILLCIWTTVCYCCCWRKYRKRKTEYFLPLYQTSTKRKYSDENIQAIDLNLLPAIEQPKAHFGRKHSSTKLATLFLGLIMLPMIPFVRGGSPVIAITATSNTCEADAHGWLQCTFEQASELFLSSATEATLLLNNDENIPFGTLKITPFVQHVCIPTTEHYTRIAEISSGSVKRCPGMGQCFGTNCAKLDKDDHVDGIGKANQLPGVTGCVESCGGIFCGCVGWNEGCTFYRFFATPINNNVVKVLHCNNWKTAVKLNVTLIGQRKLKENHVILLEEGETVNTNEISYSLLNINQNSILADVVLIDNGKSAAVVDQFGIAASQILKCPTLEDATVFTNSSCSLKFESCRCRPADGIVHCDCRDNTVLAQYFTEMLLPRKLGNNFLQKADDKIIITSNSRIQLKVGLQKLKLSTVVDRNKCKATVQSLTGCINCMAGAMLNITCLTDFGTAEGHVTCPSASFAIKCTTTAYSQTINLQFPDAIVKETCQLQCPGEKSEFELDAMLWRARDVTNDWKMVDDHKAATPSLIEELKAAANSIQEFLFNNYFYMIILLLSFVAIIIIFKLF